ncbi:WYL domain-containing protein [Streptomyces sp. H27-C3]|uniref:helix-turn-helix transcriptional regulator n=1 Tax=Streptomyces sp. H27-C3 TaxID=3046305 RepID=UPI0024B8DE0E|nr:WYL domain-containing protein [Streptomyces sp. H27-C3]MDJ0466273.1 WYL domain-containing protein [Streptomyces sp. H27-C3]
MRADRLVATLLFLQSRERVTVREVAAELEISERTARRDLEALATAGVPVYSQPGRGGGWSLVGGARTDLSGLNTGEIRALFLFAGAASSAVPELRLVLRKLMWALPSRLRPAAEAASRTLVIDETDWPSIAVGAEDAHLRALQQAVIDGLQVRVGYTAQEEPAQEWAVHPLGLVFKAGCRYLVAGSEGGLRVFEVGRITAAVVTGEPVDRPESFNLAAVWRSFAGQLEERLLTATVRARVRHVSLLALQSQQGIRVRVGREVGGWVGIEVDGPSLDVLVARLAGLGSRVEVVGPPEACERLARLAGELASLYLPPNNMEQVSRELLIQ